MMLNIRARSPLSQFNDITDDDLRYLEGLSWKKLFDLDKRNLGEELRGKLPLDTASRVYQAICRIPKVKVTADVRSINHASFSVNLTLTPTFEWTYESERFWIRVENDGRQCILYQDDFLLEKRHESYKLPFTLPVSKFSPIHVFIGSERCLGSVTEIVVHIPSAQVRLEGSENDWRDDAIAAKFLYLRANHLYVSSKDMDVAGDTYVVPANILKTFLRIGHLRTQIAGYMYGKSKSDNPRVKEIHCLVMPPQWGTDELVHLPSAMPQHESLDDFELLGWMHTQPSVLRHLSPKDVITCTTMKKTDQWNAKKCIVLTCSPSGCFWTLSAYKVTGLGYEWAQETKRDSSYGYLPTHYEKVHICSRDDLCGFYLVPDNGPWNYNFLRAKYSPQMKYELKIDIPLEYYHESHRRFHFLE